MKKKVTILGKMIPVWMIAMLLIASGAGAAVGTVLQGNVVGEMPVTVGQALLVGAPVQAGTENGTTDFTALVDNAPQPTENDIDTLTLPDRFIGVVRDDHTAFQAAAEIDQGDIYAFWVPLKNASDEELIAQLTLDFGECIEVEVIDNVDGNVNDVTRTTFNTWKIRVAADAEMDPPTETDGMGDSILIVVQVDDHCDPGYYSLSGEIHQISY